MLQLWVGGSGSGSGSGPRRMRGVSLGTLRCAHVSNFALSIMAAGTVRARPSKRQISACAAGSIHASGAR